VGGSVPTATPTSTKPPTTTSTSVSPGAPTQTGIVAGCRKYYIAVSGDGCWAIANSQGINLSDFYAWNPSVGSDCANLWVNYAYCVLGPASAASSTTKTMSSTTAGGVAPPGPTQSGVIATCKKWHTVVSGDGCWALQQQYAIADFATLYSWNPSIGSNCEYLALGYSVCVGV
jgi:LysM repeat protein